MAKAKVSKNAKTTRGSGIKIFFNDKEIVPVLFVGNFIGVGKYIAAQDKATKDLILDGNKLPISWNVLNKEYRNS